MDQSKSFQTYDNTNDRQRSDAGSEISSDQGSDAGVLIPGISKSGVDFPDLLATDQALKSEMSMIPYFRIYGLQYRPSGLIFKAYGPVFRS